jgi:thioredoxin reductase (NADPH)
MAGKQVVFHIGGWSSCGFYNKAASVLASLSVLFPSRLRVVNHMYGSRDEYRSWLLGQDETNGFRDTFAGVSKANKQTSSPFSWIEADGSNNFVGGCDDTLDWCKSFVSPAGDSGKAKSKMQADGHTADHGYDYDLVVIGGGSGGLAASKEAARFGAKVAVLDFVKPSPAGSTWGLGGTCVNVGCIPKKLMHNAALIGEILTNDVQPYGFTAPEQTEGHKWESMRESVQNHIRGLNFNYRVTLREKNVTYLNKLGKFIDAHTLELTDKKGKVSQLTSSRFIVATGGRPTTLDCEGGEHAITSDDIFSLEKSPGKTLCVGASYISLECAGFLAGLGLDTTVAVRSILLRGFDREIADKIGAHMEDHGVKFKNGVVPSKLEKASDGKITVTFSDGSSDVYDTVLTAIGRRADTEKLGVDTVGVKTNPKNGKIVCTDEQTSVSNIYAIGDVMEGCPELTPVAIQAGKMLSRRLFDGSDEPMDYQNICTTVFTPLEYGVVGMSEEDAKAASGCGSKIEVYHSNFTPLEWSLSEHRQKHPAFCKVIVSKDDDRVLGMHYLGPHAGEVTQGFGVSMKKGMTFDELTNTVGIHPTSAETFTDLTITKSSGESADSKGC